jgi:cardiolipin synthase A/B
MTNTYMNNNYLLSFKAKDCLNSIKEKIAHAKISVDIEIFYFMEDSIGSDFLILLIEKAKQGLKIRVLLDHVGAYDLTNSKTLSILKDYNIKVLFFNSLLPFSKNRKTIWYFRNHRRTIIIDKEYVFTGSVCIGEPTTDWIELGIFIKDNILAEKAQTIFNQTWNKVYQSTFNIGSVSKKELESKSEFSYITQSPLQFKRYIYKYYLECIKNAQKDIYLISPYLVPNRKFINSLIDASKRNINIIIIVPRTTNWSVVDLARNTHIHKLLKNEINIYFHKRMVHSKFAIFDNKEAFLGTMNLDNLSLRYNYENGIKILNQDCISELNDHIKNDLLPDCVKIDLESWKNRGFILKILEKFVWIVRAFL